MLTPARRQLASRWPWIAAVLAALIVAPNIAWQIAHGWPSLEFYRNAALHKNQPIGPLQVLGQQLMFMSPGTLPIWLTGLGVLLKRTRPVDLRHLALTYVVLIGFLMASGQSRPDRAVGIYPVLFAAGGLALGPLAATRRWFRFALPAWMAAWGLVLLPIGVPVLPPDQLSAYAGSSRRRPPDRARRREALGAAAVVRGSPRVETLVHDAAAVRDSLPRGRTA